MNAGAPAFVPGGGGGERDNNDGLAALAARFPHVGPAHLAAALAAVGGDAAKAAAVLTNIEGGAEAAGRAARASVRAAAPARVPPPAAFPTLPGARPVVRPVVQQPPPTLEDEFPALGAAAAANHRAPPTTTLFATAAARGGGDAEAAAAAASRAAAARAVPPVAPAMGGTRGALASAADAPRVETGAAVAAAYATARQEASDLSRARNTAFEQATLAYRAGDKALAKELGARGRELDARMRAAHAAAAAEIQGCRGGAEDTCVLDLHGLHAAEATAAVEAALAARTVAADRTGGLSQPPLRVITGVGAHTVGGRARVPGAVEGVLRERRVKWRERGGVFVVE